EEAPSHRPAVETICGLPGRRAARRSRTVVPAAGPDGQRDHRRLLPHLVAAGAGGDGGGDRVRRAAGISCRGPAGYARGPRTDVPGGGRELDPVVRGGARSERWVWPL